MVIFLTDKTRQCGDKNIIDQNDFYIKFTIC